MNIEKFSDSTKITKDLDEKFKLIKEVINGHSNFSTNSFTGFDENRVVIKNIFKRMGFVGVDFSSDKEEGKDEGVIINMLSVGKPNKNFIVIPSDAVITCDERSMISDKLEEIFQKLKSFETDSVSQSVELIDPLISESRTCEQQLQLLKRELKNCRNPLRKQQIQREIQDLKRLGIRF